jgi:hypothetical protein
MVSEAFCAFGVMVGGRTGGWPLLPTLTYNLPFPAVDNLDEVALADIKLHMMRRKRKADRKLAIRPSPEHF